MTDETLNDRFELARALGSAEAPSLAEALAKRRGAATEIDAEAVEHLGGLCLQVLIAAQRGWLADGKRFLISNPSEPFRRDLALLGHRFEFPSKGDACT